MRNVIIITFLLIIFAKLLKNKMDKDKLEALLLSVGFPKETVKLFVAQAAFESGGLTFSSAVNRADNNLTGIIFINKPFQKNATPGTQMPLKDTGGKPAYYAHFDSLEAWAKDYKRILSFGSMPILAQNADDLAERLKKNGYYGADQNVYANGILHYLKLIS